MTDLMTDNDLRDGYEILGIDFPGEEEESHSAFTCDECRSQAKRLADTPAPGSLVLRAQHFAGEERPGTDELGDTPQVSATTTTPDGFDGAPREAAWLSLLDALEDFYRNGGDGGEGGPCDMEGRDVLLTGDLDEYGDPILKVEMDDDYYYDLWS